MLVEGWQKGQWGKGEKVPDSTVFGFGFANCVHAKGGILKCGH